MFFFRLHGCRWLKRRRSSYLRRNTSNGASLAMEKLLPNDLGEGPGFLNITEFPIKSDEEWKTLTFRERVKICNEKFLRDNGICPVPAFIATYACIGALWWAGVLFFMDPKESLVSEMNMKRFLLYSILHSILGFGATSLLGQRFKLAVGGTGIHFIWPGTICSPTFPSLVSLVSAVPARRSVLAVLCFVAYALSLLNELLKPEPSVVLPVVLLAVCTIFDYNIFSASRGEHYGCWVMVNNQSWITSCHNMSRFKESSSYSKRFWNRFWMMIRDFPSWPITLFDMFFKRVEECVEMWKTTPMRLLSDLHAVPRLDQWMAMCATGLMGLGWGWQNWTLVPACDSLHHQRFSVHLAFAQATHVQIAGERLPGWSEPQQLVDHLSLHGRHFGGCLPLVLQHSGRRLSFHGSWEIALGDSLGHIFKNERSNWHVFIICDMLWHFVTLESFLDILWLNDACVWSHDPCSTNNSGVWTAGFVWWYHIKYVSTVSTAWLRSISFVIWVPLAWSPTMPSSEFVCLSHRSSSGTIPAWSSPTSSFANTSLLCLAHQLCWHFCCWCWS